MLQTARNKAVLIYLHAQGHDEAFEALKAESGNVDFQLDDPANKRMQGMLEKKWTSVIRLQKKVRRGYAKVLAKIRC
jgi:platelet-activating factor acetylhydrolase IB subunit alpha